MQHIYEIYFNKWYYQLKLCEYFYQYFDLLEWVHLDGLIAATDIFSANEVLPFWNETLNSKHLCVSCMYTSMSV